MCWNRWTFEATPDAWRLAWHSEADEPLALGGHGALDQFEVVEGDAGAHGDAFEGVVGDVAGDADLLGDQAVEVAEEGGAAGEDDAAVDDVGGELGGSALADRADGADDRLEGVGDALGDVGGGHGNGAREAADLVAAADLVGELLLEGQGAADGDLQLLGGAVADDDVVAALDVVGDGVVEAVAGDADALGDDDAVHRDDGGFGAAAADVDNHVALRDVDGDAGADGGGQRFGDDVGGTAGTGGLSGVLDGALLDAGDAGGHADHDLGPDAGDAADDAGDEVAEHGLGGDVVGDDALAHRADDLDGAGGAAEHVAGFLADGDERVVALGDGDDGGLVDDDAAALDVDEAVGGAEVYADALTEHGYSASPRSTPRQPGRINPPR